MKYFFPLMATAMLGLSACSQESAQTAPPASQASAAATTASAPAAAPASAGASAANASAPAAADKCAFTVEANDSMKYNTTEIAISKACANFTITLKNTGTLPKTAMGHDVVIAKAADVNAIAGDGAAAGVDNNFLKPNDSRVLAHTSLIGGGEEASLSIDPAKLTDGDYEFFCSFPGHLATMRGKIKLVD